MFTYTSPRITVDHKDRYWSATVEYPTKNWVLLDVQNNEVDEAELKINNSMFGVVNVLVKTFADNSGYVVETLPKDYRQWSQNRISSIESEMCNLAESVGECKLFDDGIIWEHTL